ENNFRRASFYCYTIDLLSNNWHFNLQVPLVSVELRKTPIDDPKLRHGRFCTFHGNYLIACNQLQSLVQQRFLLIAQWHSREQIIFYIKVWSKPILEIGLALRVGITQHNGLHAPIFNLSVI